MSQEIWKDIPGYEGLYRVSSIGNVQSVPSTTKNSRGGRKRTGEVMRQAMMPNGYPSISLNKDGRAKSYRVHRLVALAFHPNPENKPCINHKNCNRSDNRVENLEWCTWSENNSHAHKYGAQRKHYGQNHHNSKITQEIANEIRAKYIPNVYSMSTLGKEYNLANGTIQAILENRTWQAKGQAA